MNDEMGKTGMKRQNQLTFLKAEYSEYSYILKDGDIGAKVSRFLLEYVSAEALYKRMLIYEKKQKKEKLSKAEIKNLKVKANEVKNILAYFGILADEALIERIFGSNDKNYGECSLRKLRDRLVHNVNENVLRCILERYDGIMADLETFSALFSD